MAVDKQNFLPYAAPETTGVPSRALLRVMESFKQLKYVHSVIFMRHGCIIGEGWAAPFAPDVRHHVFSLSKSFTSLAVGICIGEGLFSPDDRLVELFADKLPEDGLPPESRINRMRVRDLLTMRSGHGGCVMTKFYAQSGQGDWERIFLSAEPEYEPGTHFAYNSGASFMLSALVQKRSGMKLLDFLQAKLFCHMGISDVLYQENPDGINLGGWGMWVTTADIARLTELLRCRGVWRGRRLVPENYIIEAVLPHADNSANQTVDWQLGYGFQFWRTSYNSFRGDGACGQYALVMPDQDFCMAMTAGLSNMQQVLDILWQELLPELKETVLPPDAAGESALQTALQDWRMPVADGELARRGANAIYRTTEKNLPGIEELEVTFGADCCQLRMGGELLSAGFGHHITGLLRLNEPTARRVAASCAWRDENTLEILICYYETPYLVTFSLDFSGGGLTLGRKSNITFLNPDWDTLHFSCETK